MHSGAALDAVALYVCLTPAAPPLGRRFAAEQNPALCRISIVDIDDLGLFY
jgi:hypothetical protein